MVSIDASASRFGISETFRLRILWEAWCRAYIDCGASILVGGGFFTLSNHQVLGCRSKGDLGRDKRVHGASAIEQICSRLARVL